MEESMTEAGFPVTLELRTAVPGELDCGAPFRLDIVVETASGADLSGAPYEVRDAAGGVLKAGELPGLRRITPDSDEYDPRHGPVDQRPFAQLDLIAPKAIGDSVWTLHLPASEANGVRHEAASLSIRLATRRHRVSIVVWEVPSPVTAGAPFELCVGARCSAGCNLHGQVIEIRDADGQQLAAVPLGDMPAPGTDGLYYARVALDGPANPGQARWSAAMAKTRRRTSHVPPAPAAIDFIAVAPGDHRVRVLVADEATGSPIARATVRMGPHRAHTDASGMADLLVPEGAYQIRIMKDTYVAPDRPLVVEGDIELRLAISVPPERDPYERYWKS